MRADICPFSALFDPRRRKVSLVRGIRLNFVSALFLTRKPVLQTKCRLFLYLGLIHCLSPAVKMVFLQDRLRRITFVNSEISYVSY